MARKILLGIVIFFLVIQVFRIDKTNPPVIQSQDILKANSASPEIASILKTSCYDCHSNETKYPWYSNIAPVSWLIARDRNGGRKHLNFSIWTTYDKEKQQKKLLECKDEITDGKMPMAIYIVQHSEAELTAENKKTLLNWFTSVKDSIK